MNIKQLQNIKIDDHGGYIKTMKIVTDSKCRILSAYNAKHFDLITNTFDKLERHYRNFYTERMVGTMSCTSNDAECNYQEFAKIQKIESDKFVEDLMKSMKSKLDKRDNLKDFDDN